MIWNMELGVLRIRYQNHRPLTEIQIDEGDETVVSGHQPVTTTQQILKTSSLTKNNQLTLTKKTVKEILSHTHKYLRGSNSIEDYAKYTYQSKYD